jgi:cyclopropane-fatty-acyl-phospholipid synthase
VTAVSNSGPQGESIRRRAREAGLDNVTVHTADVARFDPGRRFDRIVSVEMLEHLRNYPAILSRIAGWLAPDGAFFVHVFSHRRFAYLFDETARGDWMARYFFAGGTMPSHDLLPSFVGGSPDAPTPASTGSSPGLRCTNDWWLPGTHYARTLEAWLARYDARRDEVVAVLAATYGVEDAAAWWARWRLFFISCAETFAFRNGSEWGVSHYVFRPAAGRLARSVPREEGQRDV